MKTDSYASRQAYLDLLDWAELMTGVFPGDFPLSAEEVTFIASHAEFAGGQDHAGEQDQELVDRLLVEYEEAHQHTEHGNAAGRAEFRRVQQEIRGIFRARFGRKPGDGVYDTIEYYATAREELAAAREGSPVPLRSDAELRAIADRLRDLLPEIHRMVMSALAP